MSVTPWCDPVSVTAGRSIPQQKRLYQPPLPWNNDPSLVPAKAGRSTSSPAPASTTKGRRIAADSRRSVGPATSPPPAVSYGDWRLDEKTRRAGRQGVAAARAALAGAARPGERRQANAA